MKQKQRSRKTEKENMMTEGAESRDFEVRIEWDVILEVGNGGIQ